MKSIEYGQTYTNIDVPNNDIAMLQNISTRQRCIEECQVIPQCVAVAYRSSDHTCFPKQSAGGLVSKIGIDTVFMTSTRKCTTSIRISMHYCLFISGKNTTL